MKGKFVFKKIQSIGLIGGLLIGMIAPLMSATPVYADEGQLGTQQVTLNPGGGILDNGTDGLRFTVNATFDDSDDYNYAGTAGQDALVYRGTYQYCCSAGAPMLNIGGTLYGQAGPSSDLQSADWGSITILNTSGSAATGSRTSSTGNGSVTLRYSVVHNSRTYTMDRAVTYTYPNNYVTDAYTFVIPSGNTEVVKFYQGGDTAPGSDDNGFGVMLTSPVRSIISLNPDTATQFGFREVASNRPFDGARSEYYGNKYDAVFAGEDIGFNVDTEEHDAGLMIQWNFGTTPGTWTGTMQQFVVRQGANMSAAFTPSSTSPGTSSDLTLTLDNANDDTAYALGYSLTLPDGLTIAPGDQTNTCGGEVVADEATTDIILGKGTLAASASCMLTIPVVGEESGTYAFDEQSAADLKGGIVADLSGASLTIEDTPNTFGNDKNGDDVEDELQANVAVYLSAISGKYVVLEVDDNCAIDTSGLKAESANIAPDPGFDYPQGLLDFTVDCGTPGYETTVKQYFYDVAPTGLTMRKYNPTARTYTSITNATFTTQNAYGRTATVGTYKVRDGGPLDLDGLVNGVIVDPAGPGVVAVGVPNTGFGR